MKKQMPKKTFPRSASKPMSDEEGMAAMHRSMPPSPKRRGRGFRGRPGSVQSAGTGPGFTSPGGPPTPTY